MPKTILNAMRYYISAERYINDFDDDNIKGLLYIGMATTYRHYYDFNNAAKAFNKAYKYFDSAGKKHHRNYSLLNEGLAYSNLLDNPKCIKTLNQVIEYANSDNDTTIIKSAMRSLIMIYVDQKQIHEANRIYQEYSLRYSFYDAIPSTIASLALLHTYNNDSISANKYLKLAWSKSASLQDTIDIFSCSERIYKYNGNNALAYNDFIRWKVRQDTYVRKSLEQPILSVQNELLQQELDIKNYKAGLERLVGITSGLIILIIAVFIILILRNRLKHKQRVIDDSILVVEDLRKLTMRNHEILQQAFNNNFSIIDKLGKDIYDLNNEIINPKTLFTDLNAIITDLRHKDTYYKFEHAVNSCRQNIMQNLRNNVSNLREIEYKQMCFHYAGLSIKTISILTEETISAIYKRKTRLKAKIKSCATIHLEQLLNF